MCDGFVYILISLPWQRSWSPLTTRSGTRSVVVIFSVLFKSSLEFFFFFFSLRFCLLFCFVVTRIPEPSNQLLVARSGVEQKTYKSIRRIRRRDYSVEHVHSLNGSSKGKHPNCHSN